jgi:hypothetical protein
MITAITENKKQNLILIAMKSVWNPSVTSLKKIAANKKSINN